MFSCQMKAVYYMHMGVWIIWTHNNVTQVSKKLVEYEPSWTIYELIWINIIGANNEVTHLNKKWAESKVSWADSGVHTTQINMSR